MVTVLQISRGLQREVIQPQNTDTPLFPEEFFEQIGA